MKRFILIALLGLLQFSARAQDQEMFRIWYLTEVIIDNTSYLPSDYGFYPIIRFDESGVPHGLQIDVPIATAFLNVSGLLGFTSNPNNFTVTQEWFEFPTELCNEDPFMGGPCTFIHDTHQILYYEPASTQILMSYELEMVGNDLYTLEVVNTVTQDKAFYSSQLLSANEFKENTIMIIPNPIENNLIIRSDGAVEISSLKIFSIHGQLIKEYTNPTASLNVSEIPSGLYFVRIVTSTGNVTKRVVKK